MGEHRLWYIRRDGGEPRGPFPVKVIRQHLLLGRIRPDDEASHDGHRWGPVSGFDELVPEEMKGDMSDPEVRARFEAARRWADERLAIDRRTVNGPTTHPDRRGRERRATEPQETVTARQLKTRMIVEKRQLRGGKALALASAVVALVLLIWGAVAITPRPPVPEVDCGAAPAPGIHLTSCNLRGRQWAGVDLSGAHARNADLSGSNLSRAIAREADFAYADLTRARITGADFRGARLIGADLQLAILRGTDLRGADLAYANLFRADLAGANLEGARLERAVWIDGSICRKGSVGQCLPSGEVLPELRR